MKKFTLALIAAAGLLLASCTSIGPVCATSNTLGSKVGESSGTFLFGVLPLNADYSIQSASRKAGITKISTVDVKTTIGLFTVKYTTIVTGE